MWDIIFLSAHSSYYEGRVNLGFILPRLLSSPKCLAVFTRDALTAADLNRQGLKKAKFVGNPVMDNLHSTAKDLPLIPEVPTIALLPGSRLPEASDNLILLLQLVKEIVDLGSQPLQFIAALVPSLMPELDNIALRYGWENHSGKLCLSALQDNYPHKLGVEVLCYSDAFADILQHANLVIGMTGTAVEQSVGLGKPVISVSGNGPSFTYRFAEAQHRLLGESVQVFAKQPANHEVLKEAALGVYRTLQDEAYLARCAKNGLERMGRSGASIKIADFVVNNL
ncbi:lipid-A-disaccharide synthase-related protein [Microcoleus sp. CAWBG640]|uniref:lipid-A-disaccharide synthase-related protein n=1 Tax=Microcoleus sp. CAWBG640 TaxID=2841653 RepID=UPI00312B9131